MIRFCLLCVSVSLWFLSSSSPAKEPLPNTKPLTETGDLARKMVDGIHAYLDRELAASPAKRDGVKPDRERLRKILGVVDTRLPRKLECYGQFLTGGRVTPTSGCETYRVRWDVLPGLQAEGLYIKGAGEKRVAFVVAIPHAGQTPEQLAGIGEHGAGYSFALDLAEQGCDVYIPAVLDRTDIHSANPRLNRSTNLPHREFVQRMAYEMGRTVAGLEVQQVLAVLPDWKVDYPIGVIGFGDGGRVALYAAALDERIKVCQVAGAFGPQESLWKQPIDRNAWGLLREFGDAEMASLIAPRKLIVDQLPGPEWGGPQTGKPGRSGAAPGMLEPVTEGDLSDETARARKRVDDAVTSADSHGKGLNTGAFLQAFGVPKSKLTADALRRVSDGVVRNESDKPEVVQKRLLDRQVNYIQKLWRDSDAVRKEFWKKADTRSLDAYEKSTVWYRNYFHEEVIGKLPEPTMPLNPRTRQVHDEKTWAGHEVMLDVYPDVFAYGILLLPKDLKPGEKRPVVVCQHGLEGTPRHTIDAEKRPVYNQFSRRLVEMGYIVYAPQNPYIGGTHFRQIQRKAHPLKASLFSFIVRQHQRTLDWLETLPNVDAKKIGFYGLSYGGKTAMRVPAIEKRYCLSICSADFNEWVGKCVSVDLDRGYMWTIEYDMYEFDLGHTFNYAEMAYLIAPRPFMVERGHDDGVGTDEMVAYEYAKIRYLYANRLKIPERTAIEFSPGGHQIFLKGTLAFLEQHLGKPK
jgi:dienelactone hydrolase